MDEAKAIEAVMCGAVLLAGLAVAIAHPPIGVLVVPAFCGLMFALVMR